MSITALPIGFADVRWGLVDDCFAAVAVSERCLSYGRSCAHFGHPVAGQIKLRAFGLTVSRPLAHESGVGGKFEAPRPSQIAPDLSTTSKLPLASLAPAIVVVIARPWLRNS